VSPDAPVLRPRPDVCGPVDLLVGIPSCNHAGTIAGVVQAVQAGLASHFPGNRAVLVHLDGGSSDGTPEAVRALVPEPGRLVQAVHLQGAPGPGSALRALLAVAGDLDARACAVVGPDLLGLRPAWMDLLLGPVLREGFDLVAPLYLRHKYDGTLNNGIVHPLTRSLYGQRIRQPVAGEFGFSGKLARHYLAQGVWESELARTGIDAWLAPTAVADGFRACQAYLGKRGQAAPAAGPRNPAPAVPGILQQVVGAEFDFMEAHPGAWKDVRGSVPVPRFGPEPAEAPEPVRVDAAGLARSFRRGVRDLQGLWDLVLRPGATHELGRIGVWDPSRFYFPTDLWVRVLHDFALGWHRRVMDRQHLLQALTPIYLGWVASWAGETRQASAQAAEELEERVCLRFEALKPELSGAWDAPGEPRPGIPLEPALGGPEGPPLPGTLRRTS